MSLPGSDPPAYMSHVSLPGSNPPAYTSHVSLPGSDPPAYTSHVSLPGSDPPAYTSHVSLPGSDPPAYTSHVSLPGSDPPAYTSHVSLPGSDPTRPTCPSRAPTPQHTRPTCPSPPSTPNSLHSTCKRSSHPQAAKISQHSLLQSNQAKSIAKVLPTNNEVTQFDRLRTELKYLKDKKTAIPSKLQKRYNAISSSLKSKLIEVYRAHSKTLNTWKEDFETKHENTPQKQDYPQALQTVNHTKELAQTILLHEWNHII